MTAKRKPGRPTIPPEQRRTHVLSVRVTEEVMAAIEGLADHDGRTASSWAADVLSQVCGMEPGRHAPKDRRPMRERMRLPAPNPLEEECEEALRQERA